RDGDDIASFDAIHRHAFQTAISEHLGGAAIFNLVTVNVDRLDRHVDFQPTAFNAASQDAAKERVAIEQGGEHLELAGLVEARIRNMANNGLEKRDQVAFTHIGIFAGIAGTTGSVEAGEIELLVSGAQRHEKIEHFV